MTKRDIVGMLTSMLSRNNVDLLMLSIMFLKKLSVFQENKNEMVENNLIEKSSRLIPCNHEALLRMILRLYYNVSFDSKIREAMVKQAMIPRYVELLKKPQYRGIIIRILYNISIDDRCKGMFIYTECIPLVVTLITSFPQPQLAKELAGLAINLTIHNRNVEIIAKTNGAFRSLMDRALKNEDTLMMKIVRNMSVWSLEEQQKLDDLSMYRYKELWGPYVPNIIRMAQGTSNPDILLECVGILSNLTPYDLSRNASFATYIKDYNLLEWLYKHMVPGFSQDDLLLEVIMLVAGLCLAADVHSLVLNSRIPQILLDTMRAKENDEEILLQTLFCFSRMMVDLELGGELLYRIGIATDVAELLGHPNQEIAKMAEAVGKMIIEHDQSQGSSEFADMIKQHRFEMHNREWIGNIVDDDYLSKSNLSDDDYGFSAEMKDFGSPKSFDSSTDGRGAWRGAIKDVSSLEADKWDGMREWGVESPSEDSEDLSYMRGEQINSMHK
jgi:hypothetical protein